MRLDDISWTAAPPPRHRVGRAVGWSAFWLAVVLTAVAMGWGLAESILSGRLVIP